MKIILRYVQTLVETRHLSVSALGGTKHLLRSRVASLHLDSYFDLATLKKEIGTSPQIYLWGQNLTVQLHTSSFR